MVVDDSSAFVKSLNWDSENLTATVTTRVVTDDAGSERDRAMLRGGLVAKRLRSRRQRALIWCNNNGRARIAHFIDQAKNTIFVQNERYQDPVIRAPGSRRERGVRCT
jgi:hypothetical protein